MSTLFEKAWSEVIRPMFKRPDRVQVAALCWRGEGAEKEVLLVTSRGTGRWILPKGWPIDGLEAPEAAMQEAWEEAGVEKGKLDEEPLGEFRYDKELDTGGVAPVSATVYPIKVKRLADQFPESDQRRRKWVPARKAAEMVRERELQQLLRAF
ncbi:NUDIX hydrolase [Aliiroseovarius sp.]|uniref:NUDIX hydrolase n=1 Tax=Aliiroseovarius sp. TaxID=1872442 RepID=UPI003BAAE189